MNVEPKCTSKSSTSLDLRLTQRSIDRTREGHKTRDTLATVLTPPPVSSRSPTAGFDHVLLDVVILVQSAGFSKVTFD